MSTDGSRLYVANTADNTITVINTTNNAVVGAPIVAGKSPYALAVCNDGGRLYVTNAADGSVTVIDIATNTLLGTPISVGNAPVSILAQTGGTRVYTINADGTVSLISVVTATGSPTVNSSSTPVVNAANGAVTGSLNFASPIDGGLLYGVTRAPIHGQVVVNADGTYTYTPTQSAREASGASANSMTDSFVVTARTGTGAATSQTVQVAISPVSPAKVIANVAPWTTGFRSVMSPDGTRIYTLRDNRFAVIDSATGNVLHNVEGDFFSGPIALTPDGQRAYVAVTSFFVQVVDTGFRGDAPSVAPSVVVESIPIPYTTGSYTGVNVVASPDGERIYVAKQWGGVFVIDTQTNTMIDVNPQTEDFIDPILVNADGLPRLTVSPDSTRLYSIDSRDSLLQIVDTASFEIIRTVAVGGPQEYPVTLSQDGRRAYAVNINAGTLSVVDTETYSVTTVPIGNDLTNQTAAVLTPDGKHLYVPGYRDVYVVDTSGTPTVSGKIIAPLGAPGETSDIRGLALSGDGSRLYISGASHANVGSVEAGYVSVVNTTTNTVIGSRVRYADRAHTHGVIGLSPDGRVLALSGTQNLTQAISIVSTGTSNPPPPTPATSSMPIGPSTVEELWRNLKRYAQDNHDSDGIFIQTVTDDEGKNRMIVYLGGTTADNTDQAWWENIYSYVGIPKQDQIDAIDQVLTLCSANASCGSIDEIMLVGYSQGGIDAQNLAFWNSLHGATGSQNRVPVTTVVTFGSPVTTINPGVTSIHIQDTADGVVRSVELAESRIPLPWSVKLFLLARKASALVRGEIYTGRAPTPIADDPFAVHENYETYRYLSNKFWNTPSGEFNSQKENLGRFFGGHLIDPSDAGGIVA